MSEPATTPASTISDTALDATDAAKLYVVSSATIPALASATGTAAANANAGSIATFAFAAAVWAITFLGAGVVVLALVTWAAHALARRGCWARPRVRSGGDDVAVVSTDEAEGVGKDCESAGGGQCKHADAVECRRGTGSLAHVEVDGGDGKGPDGARNE